MTTITNPVRGTEIIGGASIVTPAGVITDGWLSVRDGRIAAVGAGASHSVVDWDLGGRWLVPGFVDMHCHGGGGATVFGADPDQIDVFATTHRMHGTTSLVASLITDSYESLAHDVAGLADLAADGVIAAIHLEGPWISPVRKGAHRIDALALPEPRTVHRLLDAGRGYIRVVTLAPELDQALDAIQVITAAGARVALGHTNASYDETQRACDAGATVATHLFNAMPPVHHRSPGAVVALLTDDRVTIELILDGVHIAPEVATLVRQAVGAERIALVTDAMAATGFGDGDYMLGGRAIRVRSGISRRTESGVLAGSTLTMDRAFRFAVQQAGFSVPEAVSATSTTPARLLGIGHRVGTIAEGYDADLVVLDDDFQVRAVMAGGMWQVQPDA